MVHIHLTGSVSFLALTEGVASLHPARKRKGRAPSDAATWPRLVNGCEEGDEMRYCPPSGVSTVQKWEGERGRGEGAPHTGRVVVKTTELPDSTRGRGDCHYPGRAPAPSPVGWTVPTAASTPLLEMCTVPAACIPCIFASAFLLLDTPNIPGTVGPVLFATCYP